jgi:flagellar biosynthesis anti-sigma factor FlgM
MRTGNGISDVVQIQAGNATRAEETRPAQNKTREMAKSADGSVPVKDETRLTTGGELLANALNMSDVRSAKVDALREAISSGSYSVPSSMVADKVFDSMIKP